MEGEKKPRFSFLDLERLQRLLVSFLLFVGLYVPLVLALDAGKGLAAGAILGVFFLLLFSFLGSFRKGRLYLLITLAVIALLQLILPGKGLFGSSVEAGKAIALSLNEVRITASLFATQIALLLGTVLPVLCYLFATRMAGFLPATIMTVLTMFALCTMAKTGMLWYTAPALVAILLLISRHRHDKVPMLEAMPIAAILVALAFILLPGGTTVIRPLYEKAMDLKQAITDYLFFTDEREIFSIGRYGWYPLQEEAGRMGGDVLPQDQPVMLVKTAKKTLLRGISKDRYNGASWENTFDMARYQYRSKRYEALRKSVFSEELPSLGLQGNHAILSQRAVSVQIVDTVTSTVFSPVTLRSIDNQGKIIPYFNERGELFTTHNLERDEAYTVFAPIFEGGENEIDAVMNELRISPKTQDQEFYTKYLQLPEHLEEKFYTDIQNIVSGYETDYEKACAIQRHLQKYYRYTEAPGRNGENYDFVTYFLYSAKEGYCVHFASAMAVMCRMAGIPCRYVEGFLCQPASDGLAYVTGKDAHAWVEIWIEGFGWLPFDPTPSQQRDEPAPPPNVPTPTPTPTPPPEENQQQDDTPTPTPDPEVLPPLVTPPPEEPDQHDPPSFPWLLLLIVLLIGLLIVRILMTRPKAIAQKATTHGDAAFIYAGAIVLLAELRKVKPVVSEAPMRFAKKVDQSRIFPCSIQPLWQNLTVSQYKGLELTDKAEQDAKAVYRTCYQAQSLWVRLIFVIKTAFSKNPYDILVTRLKHERPFSAYGTDALKRAVKKNMSTVSSAELQRAYARPAGEKAPDIPVESTPVSKPFPDKEPIQIPAEQNGNSFAPGEFITDELPPLSSEEMEKEIEKAEPFFAPVLPLEEVQEEQHKRRRRGNGMNNQ